MYRIFCESYQNFCKSFENSRVQDEFRYKIAKVFELITDLWTLESREIVPICFGTTPQNILEEQAKLANMFFSLLYWE